MHQGETENVSENTGENVNKGCVSDSLQYVPHDVPKLINSHRYYGRDHL